MQTFHITATDKKIKANLLEKIDGKIKPLGSLGLLEATALQLGLIQQSLTPKLTKPAMVIFAGDHGIATESVSVSPQEFTTHMVKSFLSGEAAISVFTKQHKLKLIIVNAGISGDIPATNGYIDIPIGRGTKNFLYEPAMSHVECELAIERGASVIKDLERGGTNIIGLGEMGIGNTSSAAMLTSSACGWSVADCVGRGTGLDDKAYAHKLEILEKAAVKHGIMHSPMQILATYGGYELAMIVGAILEAAELHMAIIIDGFMITAALLIARQINPQVVDYCIFSHVSAEKAHIAMVEHLQAQPLLRLGLRLGEGSGAALAFPLVQSSALFLNGMAAMPNTGHAK